MASTISLQLFNKTWRQIVGPPLFHPLGGGISVLSCHVLVYCEIKSLCVLKEQLCVDEYFKVGNVEGSHQLLQFRYKEFACSLLLHLHCILGLLIGWDL